MLLCKNYCWTVYCSVFFKIFLIYVSIAHYKISCNNWFIITWILNQIIIYSDKVKLKLVKITTPSPTSIQITPSPPLLIDERTDQ